MTYGLAVELGPRNIRVNAILPGAIAGDRIDRVIAGQALAMFLCSDGARNLSGQCIPITAGDPAS